jgi:hypothetical protein
MKVVIAGRHEVANPESKFGALSALWASTRRNDTIGF